MVDAIVSSVVQKLSDLLFEEVKFLGGVRGDVEWLKNELQSMRSFLRDAEKKKDVDHRVNQWVCEIRDVSEDAIAIIESFNVKIERHGESKAGIMAFLQSCACCCRKQADLYGIGKEIESLKNRVLEISRKRVTYGIRDIHLLGEGTSASNHVVARTSNLRRTTSSFGIDENLIGFKDVFTKLQAQLLNQDASRSVLSIYGMGGLGKTTIASKLYHSLTGFDRKAWVCVSEEYNTQDLLQCIIKSFLGQLTMEDLEKLDKMTEIDMERYLRENLKERRYLLVVDDVWHPEAWESLKRALPEDKNGSRVILTTRNKTIAMHASERNSIHELRFLTVEESWDLFRDKAFRQGDKVVKTCSPDMENLAREMVTKCQGLPLAIIVLAGILSHKDGLDEWQKVKENIWRRLKNDCIHISLLFSLSYDDLSPELQNCFLYIGMFPEDYVIDVRKLIRLWIAEELLPEEEERKEDLGQEYFNELINRSLIQGAGGRFWEEILKCRVHDLLRDLAIEKAKEVKFFDIFDQHKHSSTSFLHKRHAIHGSIRKYMSLQHSNIKLRTLLLFNQDREWIELDKVLSECLKFKSLAVLDLQGIPKYSGNLPDGLGDLIHLKFLGLSDANVNYTQSPIRNLKYLQTLEVADMLHIPIEIFELKELRYVYGRFKKGSISFKNQTKLHTLGIVEYDNQFEASTVHLSSLRELTLLNPSSLDFATNLKNLATLILDLKPVNGLDVPLQPLVSCRCLNRLWINGALNKLPTWDEFPPSLTRLILSNSKLVGDPMPTLEKLPNLRSLELLHAYYGYKMVCGAGGFPQLEVLRLRFLLAKEWEFDERAMPKITGVRIIKCEDLKVPQRLMSVPRVAKSEPIYHLPFYPDI